MFRLGLITSVLFVMAASAAGPEAEITPEQLLHKMRETSPLRDVNFKGKYLQRAYNNPAGSPNRQKFKDAVAQDIERLKDSAAKADVNKPDKDRYIEQLDEYKSKVQRALSGTVTQLITYYRSKDRMRLESCLLPNDKSLEELRTIVLKNPNGQPLWDCTISVWTGEKHKRLTRSPRGQETQDFLEVLPDSFPEPGFVRLGATLADGSFFQTMKAQNLPVAVTPSKTKDGEQATLVTVGSDQGLMYAQFECLPGKGHVIRSAQIRAFGQRARDEESNEFIRTASGLWLPMKSKVESFIPSMAGPAQLANRIEYLAIERPETNVALNDSLFDLSGENAILIKVDDPADTATNSDPSRSWNWKFAVFLSCLIILVVLWFLRTRMKQRISILSVNRSGRKSSYKA